MKSSKAQIYTKFHKIPEINFEDRQLTPFSGIIIFQLLFKRLGVKGKLKKLPDVSTISRSLSQLDDKSAHNIRRLSRSFVISGLRREQFPRLTMDFDGSVLSTKGHAER